ncbi:MAG: PilN domain-containing protein [Gammaproteobacteria bacterium]|nr:PilN domain-containing protein [Gammaproteobacteria bacterium]
MIERFLKWWWRELVAMVPPALSGRGRRHGRLLRLVLDGDQVRAERVTGKQVQILDSVPLAAAGLTETIDRWTVGLSPAETQVEVVLPRDKALVRRMKLPLAAEENLQQVVGFEMERQTPFRAGDVYFDYDLVERDHRSKTLTLNLRVATRALVDRVIAGLGGWQLGSWSDPRPAPSAQTRDDQTHGVPLQFRPAAFSEPKTGRLVLAMTVINLLLLAVLVGVPWMDKQRQLQALETELRKAQLEAAEAIAVRDAVEAKRDAVNLLIRLKGAAPSSVAILDELSQRLPDSTWLHRLELSNGKAELQGTSDTATALIALLDASQMLRGVQFSSPVTREAATGRERFHVAANVVLPAVDQNATVEPTAARADGRGEADRAEGVPGVRAVEATGEGDGSIGNDASDTGGTGR